MAENLINSEYLRSEIKRQFGTQSAFARHLGWSRQYLSQVLNGKVNVTIAQLTMLSTALDAPTSSLLAAEGVRSLKESATPYRVDNAESALLWQPTILVANQKTEGPPLLDIASLKRWSSGREKVKRFNSPEERVAFIRSLQEKYRDVLPSTAMIQQYKQEEKDLEERQNVNRA